MFENKKKTGLIIVGAVVIAAFGGGYLYFRSLLGGKALTPVEAARLVPQNALLAGYVSTDSETWYKLESFGTPEAKKLIDEIKAKLEQNSQEKAITQNINYEEDIQPWLGNMMLAALPSQTKEAKFLLVVGIKDKVAAAKFMDKFKQELQDSIEISQYKGIPIIKVESKSEGTFNIAILDDKMVVSPENKTVEKAIDTYKGGASFADKKGAKEILTQTSIDNNTLFQLYVPDYSGLLKQLMQASGENPATFKSIQKELNYVDSMLISLRIEENRGILMQSVAKYNSNFKFPKYPEISGKILSKIPGDSLLLISGGGISQTWSWLREQFEENPDLKQSLDIAKVSLKAETDLDLDRDIIGWMDGEFAISILPSNRQPAFISGAMVITTSERSIAENTLDTIEGLAKSKGVVVKDTNFAGKEVTEYQDALEGQVVLAYGWLDDRSLAISMGDEADKIISLKSSDSLAQNPDFQTITSNLPKKNLGYFYINFKEVNFTIDRLSNTYGQPVTPEAKAILNSIKGIAAVNTMVDSSTVQQDLLIELVTSK
ncbi:MAG: DUF3352 domain-containing protein [Prochloraceae cyanobacterium]|nr:DUF3352 domain-containing protein [Prochloraceae cyanobacterium]